MSKLDKKEKLGLWTSLIVGILAILGVRVPVEVIPVLDSIKDYISSTQESEDNVLPSEEVVE